MSVFSGAEARVIKEEPKPKKKEKPVKEAPAEKVEKAAEEKNRG